MTSQHIWRVDKKDMDMEMETERIIALDKGFWCDTRSILPPLLEKVCRDAEVCLHLPNFTPADQKNDVRGCLMKT